MGVLLAGSIFRRALSKWTGIDPGVGNMAITEGITQWMVGGDVPNTLIRAINLEILSGNQVVI
jgi:hypothetical protein